ncbi:diguanylate cyclase domain protein, partial [Vibrio parahaemolyticus V-223/04]
AKYVGGTRR